MAENLDPNEIEQFNRNMQELNDVLPNTIASLQSINAPTKDSTDATKQNTAATRGNTEQAKAMREAAKQQQQAYDNLKDSIYSASKAFSSLSTAIMDNKVSFEKYNSTLGAAGDAVLSLSKNFGVAGLAIGAFVKGLTTVTQLYTKQADSVLKASDDMSKMGTAGQLTSKEILSMAHNAGLYSGNIEILTKSVKSVGTGMMNLGSTVGEGTKAFAQIAAVSTAQREAFQRLGLSQEELMESQASYVKLQEMSGKSYAVQSRDAKVLQQASLEYTENLLKLSALTGKDVKQLEKEKQIANEQFEELVRTRAEDEKIKKLTAEGRLGEAKQIEDEQNARKQFIAESVSRFGEETGLQIARVARTGAYDKFTSGLANLGVDAQKLSSDLKKAKPGAETSKLFDNNAKDITEKVGKVVSNMDTAMQFGGDNLGKQFGINKDLLIKSSQMNGKDLEGARAAANKAIGSPKDGMTGLKVATDAAQVARNNLTTAEIKAKVVFDQLVAAGNPLISGFNKTTLAATALAAAAIGAAAALTKIAVMKMTGQGGDIPGKAPGAPGTGPGSKVNPKLGAKIGVAGAVGGLALGAIGSKAAESGNNNVAAAADVGSAALTGASLGATVGSVVPVLGTAVGAAVGGALGAGIGLYQNWGNFGKQKPEGEKRMDDVLNFNGASGDKKHFMMLSPQMQESVINAAEMYKQATGNKMTVNSALRTFEEQQKLWDESVKLGTPGRGPTGMLVGKPGTSIHESGNAVDIQEGKSDPRAISALQNAGLVQKYPDKDPVHFEMPSGNLEGIMSGPSSGYQALLHGTELVKRLQPDSILDKLANTPAASSKGSDDSSGMVAEIMEKLTVKLDDMIAELSTLNDTQAEIKKYSRA